MAGHDHKYKTPLLDELEKGPWPSFVKEIKRAAAKQPMAEGLLGQLEQSYKDKKTYWKHGGLVGVQGYGAGIIGRYSALGDEFPEVAAFHTVRINQPAGWFYTSKALRTLCDIWDKHGSGLLNVHGSTGDFVLLGTTSEQLEDMLHGLLERRLGPRRLLLRHADPLLLQRHGALRVRLLRHDGALPRPDHDLPGRAAPSGLPVQVQDQDLRLPERLRGLDRPLRPLHPWAPGRTRSRSTRPSARPTPRPAWTSVAEITDMCPTACMKWDGKTMKINNHECNRCMHCINFMPKALRPGKETGATILVGGKAPILEGAQLGSVIVPFMPMKAPFSEIKEFIQKLWDVWGENGNNRERIGEFMLRVGVGNFMESHRRGAEPEHGPAPPREPLHLLRRVLRGRVASGAFCGNQTHDA